MKTLKDYIEQVMREENTQGDEGTDKLTKHRKKMTPGQNVDDDQKDESINTIRQQSHRWIK